MKNSGFSIMEITIVMVMISTLAFIAMPNLFTNIKKAHDTEKFIITSDMGIVILSTRTNEKARPYNTIEDGTNDTTTEDLRSIFNIQGVSIPNSKNGHEYWYFSTRDNYLVANCSEDIRGQLIANGSMLSKNHVECTTNPKIPTAIPGGRFDGGVNFELTP